MRCCSISSSRKYTTPSWASMVCSYSCIVIASTTCIEHAPATLRDRPGLSWYTAQ